MLGGLGMRCCWGPKGNPKSCSTIDQMCAISWSKELVTSLSSTQLRMVDTPDVVLLSFSASLLSGMSYH
jgi:hypothetical protein